MLPRPLILLTLFTFTLSAEELDPLNRQATQLAASPMPKVFRSVLNKRPRMLSIELDENLAIAYDTWHPQLALAWRVDSGPLVKFDGAVYTGAHGPQPTTLGSILLDNKTPEFTSTLGTVHFVGHSTRDGHITLNYAIKDAQHKVVANILETPSWGNGLLTRALTVIPEAMGEAIVFTPTTAKEWKHGSKVVRSTRLKFPMSITTSL